MSEEQEATPIVAQQDTAPELAHNAAWGAPLNVFYCPQCHGAHLAPVDVTLPVCPACMQATLSPEPERLRREPPELMIPFTVNDQRAADAVADWARGIWFRPTDLQASVLQARLQPYYFPLWLVDGDIEASWQAEMGYEYQAASFQERYQSGGWVSQEITETRTRWEPRVGRLKRHYDNIAVPALTEHEQWMSRLGGYDFRSRKGYFPRAIARAVVRIPEYTPEAAWLYAESGFSRAASVDCQRASKADHTRNWSIHPRFASLNWTQMLVPAYVTYYHEGGAVYPVWINGQSGHVYGLKRMSQSKANTTSLIVGALAIALFLFGLLLALLGAALVAPVVIGSVLVVLGLLLGLVAPVPALWAWLGNRRSSS